MTDKMTLDDIIKELYNQLDYRHGDIGVGFQSCIHYLETHRVAIEAGCRPVLRFRQSILDKPGLYYCIQTDGRFSELIVQPWKTKDEVLKCCKSLGLTAEFVEGEKDGK